MSLLNKICPLCQCAITKPRPPEYAGLRYCSSDCAIDAYLLAKLRADIRNLSSNQDRSWQADQ